MRGNRHVDGLKRHSLRSIPAYAGEPHATRTRTIVRAVYPRVCGGTTNQKRVTTVTAGLSPRMRGNLPACPVGESDHRSIPAYAGEPNLIIGVAAKVEVYPRVCGGTSATARAALKGCGLSPRMRGNLIDTRKRLGNFGSIPAYAGEPGTGLMSDARSWVYPRVCGGTRVFFFCVCVGMGLSPRMRGNPLFSQTPCLS